MAIVLLGVLAFFQAPVQAQARYYNQAELDALLAPIALYPDPLLSQVLMAATYPEDVRAAAAWSRANPHLTGEDAVHAAQDQPWDPSVKSLLAFPEVLARMDESPQWMTDLGQAFLAQEPHVMETVQGLRRRAQASGYLQNDQTSVRQEGTYIAIYPVRPQFIYVPYYDPLVVYGGWWWPAYRPVYWRPWRPAPVFVSATFFFGAVDWHRRHVTVVRQPKFVQADRVHVSPGRWRHATNRPAPSVRPHAAVPEAKRQPIVRSLPPAVRVESPRREHRPVQSAPRPQPGAQPERRADHRRAEKRQQPGRREAHSRRDRRG
ncbi:MAG: hypothetical protein A3G81_04170 [Betaproteobacteria bacterium RIFCSPLOWO2_12_FULL_65_14]|nr:MAG: hypothetical protein A3G81_04170 [Betaproteobacteria bacterium RIFCSPLOWO2_12_FULL_65_14]